VNAALRIVVVGGGGNVLSAAAYLRDMLAGRGIPFELLGVLDDGEPDAARLTPFGLRHLGPLDLAGRCGATAYVLGAGMPDARRRLLARLGPGIEPLTVVHPCATIEHGAEVGTGCMLQPFSVAGAGATLGPHVLLSIGAVVGEGGMLGPMVSLLPNSTVGCGVRIGEGAMIGTRAVVSDGVTIGAGAVVAAGAVVTDDVEPGATVAGAPARRRWRR